MNMKQLAITGALVLLSGMAYADHDHGPTRGHEGHERCEKGRLDHANWQEKRSEHFEKHQERLHTMLQLSAQQENAWKAYQTQVRPPEQAEHPDVAALEKLNTIERLDKFATWDKAREARQAERNKAIRAFYGQLNYSQKKVFDENAYPKFGHNHDHSRS